MSTATNLTSLFRNVPYFYITTQINVKKTDTPLLMIYDTESIKQRNSINPLLSPPRQRYRKIC